MKNSVVNECLIIALAIAAVLGGRYLLSTMQPPIVPIVVPDKKPHHPHWPRYDAKLGDTLAPDGTPIQLDYPKERHLKNTGGKDGAGLCVFTSLSHSFDWHHYPPLNTFRDWMKKYPGGGYPTKVDKMIEQYCKEAGVAKPNYVQIEGNDLAPLKIACKNGYMPGITYSFSPTGRYGGQKIAHMVTLLHADDKGNYCVLDNNFPGTYEWMNEAEFKKTYTGMGGGWCVIPLIPGLPPAPHNRR